MTEMMAVMALALFALFACSGTEPHDYTEPLSWQQIEAGPEGYGGVDASYGVWLIRGLERASRQGGGRHRGFQGDGRSLGSPSLGQTDEDGKITYHWTVPLSARQPGMGWRCSTA